MPYIKVNLQKISAYSSTMNEIQTRVDRIRSDFLSISNHLDWDVKSASNIRRRMENIGNDLGTERHSLNKMCVHLSNVKTQYSKLDVQNQMKTKDDVGEAVVSPVSHISWDKKAYKYVDWWDLFKDSVKAGGTIFNAYKAGFFKSGFDIKRIGDYIYIYGKKAPRAAIEAPKGTRVRVGSDTYYGKSYALWFQKANILDKLKSSFTNFGKDTFGLVNSANKLNVSAIIGYGAIAVSTIKNIVGNVQNGASTSKIAADATVDVAKGLGSMAATSVGAKIGAALGSFIPIPGVGTIVGGVVGGAIGKFAYDYLVDGGLKIGGKSVAAWTSEKLEKVYSEVGDAFKDGAKAVKKVAEKAADTVKSAAKSVGNAFKKAGKSLKKLFR